MPKVSAKRQITLPIEQYKIAGIDLKITTIVMLIMKGISQL
ncbi:MAG: hypothetical protein ACJAUP_000375 [Cellvibrionaceae bacterium]|jgi:hypothetical protein